MKFLSSGNTAIPMASFTHPISAKFLTVEEVTAIFAGRKSVDPLSDVSSSTSFEDSFWESSEYESVSDSKFEPETGSDTKFSGSLPAEISTDCPSSEESQDGTGRDSNDMIPPCKKKRTDGTQNEQGDKCW